MLLCSIKLLTFYNQPYFISNISFFLLQASIWIQICNWFKDPMLSNGFVSKIYWKKTSVSHFLLSRHQSKLYCNKIDIHLKPLINNSSFSALFQFFLYIFLWYRILYYLFIFITHFRVLLKYGNCKQL